jgi:preprotein translocase subunit YajC
LGSGPRARRAEGIEFRALPGPVGLLKTKGPTPVFISQAFAQTAPAASSGTESSLLSLLPLVLMFVVLYFIMIRPQMKRQKEHKSLIEALAKGDEVVTAGGVLGRVSKLGESYLHVEVANGVELQVQRSSIVQVLPKGTIK